MLRTLMAVVCGLAACRAPDEDVSHSVKEIVGGVDDAGDEAVVALTVQGQAFCTGTLVAPRVVVTAAHCLDGIAPTDLEVSFGPVAGAPGALSVPVVNGVQHPWWVVANEGNDIAAVALETPAPVLPAPLNRAPFDAAFMGATVRLVGYGVIRGGTDLGAGTKREAVSRITTFADREFEYGGTAGQTCQGDSGGPAFVQIGGVEVLAGVTSRGDPDCALVGIDTRVDAQVTEFIEPFIQAFPDAPPAPPPTPPDACLGVTASGTCLGDRLLYCSAVDDTLHEKDCSAPDQSCACDPSGWCDCIPTPPSACGSLDFAGRCDGTLLTWCERGQPFTFDCALLDATCAWRDASVGNDCLD